MRLVARPINKILIHCTATEPEMDIDVKDVRQWHLARGFNDIGYHYLIKIDGSIKAGRPIELIGAHCRGQNKFSIGIAYVGGVENGQPKDTRTEEQKKSLRKLIKKIKRIYPEIQVFGHNDFSNKACPSFNVADENY